MVWSSGRLESQFFLERRQWNRSLLLSLMEGSAGFLDIGAIFQGFNQNQVFQRNYGNDFAAGLGQDDPLLVGGHSIDEIRKVLGGFKSREAGHPA